MTQIDEEISRTEKEIEEEEKHHKKLEILKAKLSALKLCKQIYDKKLDEMKGEIDDWFDDWKDEIKFPKTAKINLINRIKKLFGGEE